MPPTSLATVTRAPFGLQLRPEDAVQHETWHRACEEALAAVRRGQSVAVLGLPGTGKTFLLQHLKQLLAIEGLRVRRFEALQLPALEGQDDILLVDEADRLPASMLDGLCAGNGLFILAGLPEIARHLADQSRPIAMVTLEPLSLEGVARFVAVRLSATGYKRDLFEAEAVLALAQHSAGVPRLIVTLAGAATFLGECEGCGRVTKQHVDEAAAMRSIKDIQEVCRAGSEPPSLQPVASTAVPMVQLPEQKQHPVPLFRASRVTLALSGVVVLAALGWMLVPRHSPPSVQAQPRREASATRPVAPPPATSSPAVPAPDPAPVVPPDAARVGAAQSPVSIPLPDSPRQIEPALAFQGSVLNETMNQKGWLALSIHRSGATGVTVGFHASAGLIGSGDLTGIMTPEGLVTVSGQLMMGRNPFNTTLTATMVGNRLEGTAVFARPNASSSTRSRFSLLRS